MPAIFKWLWWTTWYAACDDVSTPNVEFVAFQVPRGTTDRLQSVAVQPPKSGHAMRVEVRDGDVAWNPTANNGQGAEIPSGWRAEAIGPTETATEEIVRYQWSTMFATDYPLNAKALSNDPVWQVVTQWHQGDSDQGTSPPIEFDVVGDDVMLTLNEVDPADVGKSRVTGSWRLASLERGSWHDFTAEIKWDMASGSIAVWHNGMPILFEPVTTWWRKTVFPIQATTRLSPVATLFPSQSPFGLPSVYLKVGLYREGTKTDAATSFVLYHDELYRQERRAIRIEVPLWRWPPVVIHIPLPWPLGRGAQRGRP